MEPSRRSMMGSSHGDSPPRSTPRQQHVRQLSSVSYGGRPPSAQSSIRPSTCRVLRPATPGGGSIGLNADVKVESRPVTQQGMMSSRSCFQGPGRQVLDKSYYLSRLRGKKQELQSEIDSMNGEIERLQRWGPANVHLEHKQEALGEEVTMLKAQLGDYNVVMEKVAAGVELDELRELLRSAKEKNYSEKKKVDQLFSERTRKEQNSKAAEEKVQLLEAEMESRVSQEAITPTGDMCSTKVDSTSGAKGEGSSSEPLRAREMLFSLVRNLLIRALSIVGTTKAPEMRAQYMELWGEACTLAADVERMELELHDIAQSGQPLEQELMKLTSAKHKAVALVEQLLSAEAELRHLKVEEVPTVHLSPEEARGSMLLKVRQDNAEIAKAEEKSNELEGDIEEYEEKIAAAERSFCELKGGRAEKFLEMQQKEKKMQAFIDNFDGMRQEHESAALCVQQRIIQVLQHISQEASTAEPMMECDVGSKKLKHMSVLADDIDELLRVMEERRRELKQLEDLEEKTIKEVASTKEKIASLQAEIDKFGRLDDLRAVSEINSMKLEAQKKTADEQKKLLQAQLHEQVAKGESIRGLLNGNEMHANLEELNHLLSSLQQSVLKLQEGVELKERETNYKPVLENIHFMVGQLNTEIKAQQLR